MSYQVLARKYRPAGFGDVFGQEHVAQTLRNALGADRVAHAYLFSGPRGVGKTTIARILAKAVNCLQSPGPEPCLECEVCRSVSEGGDVDVLEIDAASNRRVEEVQPLIESARFLPQRSARKIFIVDEAHMLSTHAFNALLKTLEEPPPHVLFILATTEPHKIPETVRSRCHRFDFRRMTGEDIVRKLRWIAEREGRTVEPEALEELALRAAGGMRDAESLLDQLMAAVPPDRSVVLADIVATAGGVPRGLRRAILAAARGGDAAQALDRAREALAAGGDPFDLLQDLYGDLRDHAVQEVRAETSVADGALGVDWCLAAAEVVGRHLNLASTSRAAAPTLDLALVALARLGDVRDLEELVHRLERIASGQGAAPRAASGASPAAPAEPSPPAPAPAPVAAPDLLETLPPETASLLRSAKIHRQGSRTVIETKTGFARDQLLKAIGDLRRAYGSDLVVQSAAEENEVAAPKADRALTSEEMGRIRSSPAVRAVLSEFRGRIEQVRRNDGEGVW